MNASQFEDELKRRIERRQPIDDDALRRLAAEDPQLLGELQRQSLLDEAIADWKQATPSVDLADRVLADWNREQTQPHPGRTSPRSQRRSAWFAFLASAASLILVGWLLSLESDLSSRNRPLESKSPLTAKTDGQSPAKLASAERPPQWNELYADAEEAYLSLFHDAADAISTGKTLVVPGEQFAAVDAPPPSAGESGSNWYRNLPLNFDTVGQKAQRTLDRLFPVEEL